MKPYYVISGHEGHAHSLEPYQSFQDQEKAKQQAKKLAEAWPGRTYTVLKSVAGYRVDKLTELDYSQT